MYIFFSRSVVFVKDENGPEEKQSAEEIEEQSQDAGGLRFLLKRLLGLVPRGEQELDLVLFSVFMPFHRVNLSVHCGLPQAITSPVNDERQGL